MTPIQSETFNLCLTEKDILAQAKTGTGKTLAFLLPTIQKILNNRRLKNENVSALIIAPTRDLAQQIHIEVQKILQSIPEIRAQIVFGGTAKKVYNDVKELKKTKPDIVIATPGRILDILENYSDVKSNQFKYVSTLVFDEADRLLDEGFLPACQKILTHLSNVKQKGQILMYSATISKDVKIIARNLLKPDFKFISTIDNSDTPTHLSITQTSLLVPDEDIYYAAYSLLKNYMEANKNHKIICFLPTARAAQVSALLFSNLFKNISVLEVHSRMVSSKRENSVQKFRNANEAIIFSSDVIARGLDFPNVGLVLQIGIPQNLDQYLHRIGRTGRAEAKGSAAIIVTDLEQNFLKKLHLSNLKIVEESVSFSPRDVALVKTALENVPLERKEQAYRAWLGFYKGFLKEFGVDLDTLVSRANNYALNVLGCVEVPKINWKLESKMGLKNVKELNRGEH
ncbi:hypothetical protein HK099_005701 [Clydaea vesicula]|uniref:ATP-dependent RNA helicase n=1 Tax=Clydaea vesicula TaxID=447962 RepID=A0AAD5XUS6_9FUNG|nr:hypothetical protein HK099_005701 [Clydaea vesicula]